MPCSAVEIFCVLKDCTASSALKMEAALPPPPKKKKKFFDFFSNLLVLNY